MDYKKLETFLNKLKSDGLTLAFAESMTAGLLINEFSKVNGASENLKSMSTKLLLPLTFCGFAFGRVF